MQLENLKNVSVDVETLSELFSLSKSYISELSRKKGFPKSSYNSYPLFEFTQRFLEYKNELFEKEKRKLRELTSSRERLEKAQADLKEIELGEKQKSLVPVQEVESIMLTAARIYVKNLESLETTLPPILINAKDQIEIAVIIRDAVYSSRTQIAEVFERAKVIAKTDSEQDS